MNQTVDLSAPGEVHSEDHRCPACERPIYQNRDVVGLGLRPADRRLAVVDPTWRHEGEGTVAVNPDGTTVCAGADRSALNNQGQPVHDDQVPYAAARRELLADREHAVNCVICFTPTWNHNSRCDDCQGVQR